MKKEDYPQNWTDRIGKFAEAVGADIMNITDSLTKVVGEPSDEALMLLSNISAVPDADIKSALEGLNIPTGKMNMHIAKLRGEQKMAEASEKNSTVGMSLLPVLPDDNSFIEELRVGGELKVGRLEVLSAIKAAIATSLGLYELPSKLLQKMEEYANNQEEPCGKEFFEIQRLLTERKYGDVLAVINVSGNFISEPRKKAFLAKLDEKLWDALKSFFDQLVVWEASWLQGANNPMMMMAIVSGNKNLPAGLAEAPDTAPLRSAGEEVINIINKVFAGPGIPVARAMAYDATRIQKIISDPKILPQAGYTSKDQMLKDLGVGVGAEIVRIEQVITRYTLAIMALPEVNADDEAFYLSSMLRLGRTIAWDKLGNKGLKRKLT